jgi:hypothetical protein
MHVVLTIGWLGCKESGSAGTIDLAMVENAYELPSQRYMESSHRSNRTPRGCVLLTNNTQQHQSQAPIRCRDSKPNLYFLCPFSDRVQELGCSNSIQHRSRQ